LKGFLTPALLAVVDEAQLTKQAISPTTGFCSLQGSRAWTHRVCRGRRVFGAGTHATENINRATIATAAATRINA